MTNDQAAPSWGAWFEKHKLKHRDSGETDATDEVVNLCEFPAEVWEQEWKPTQDDRKAAWILYTEVRTRISTQPLAFRAGDEATALDSLFKLFQFTRKVVQKHKIDCRHFATVTIDVLNVRIRPFTASWHKRKIAGSLELESFRHEFRGDLLELQKVLKQFIRFLGLLAEGDDFIPGTESTLRIPSDEHDCYQGTIPFEAILGPEPHKEENGVGYDEILQREKQYIDQRRTKLSIGEGSDDLIGLSLSGGGIRSATFCQGVLQGLAERGLLKEIDFLSTVSGGGYIGSLLSSLLNDADSPKEFSDHFGLREDQEPFRRDRKCESDTLRYVRNNSKYLLPTHWFSKLHTALEGVYGIFVGLVILLPFMTFVIWLTHGVYDQGFDALNDSEVELTSLELSEFLQYFSKEWSLSLPVLQELPLGATFRLSLELALVWVGLVFLLPLVQKISRWFASLHGLSRLYGNFCVGFFAFALIPVFVLQSIPLGYFGFLQLNRALGLLDSRANFSAEMIWVVLGNLITFISARGLIPKSDPEQPQATPQISLFRKVLFVFLWLTGPLLIVLSYYLMLHLLVVQYHVAPSILLAVTVVLVCYVFLAVNINLISPHRYYRNCLARTYQIKSTKSRPEVHPEDPQLLSDLGKTYKAPYHLINAAVNLQSSENAELRGRDSDFFLFSRFYSGSPVIGYFQTESWENVDQHLNLGTATAISAAAASSLMGANAPKGASFFLTLLNIRLGYWVRHPTRGFLPRWLVKKFGGPGPGYLIKEMFGRATENTKYLNLSDGGHIENLGIYELLRRRCKFIIAVDAERDSELQFTSLMKLHQFAWIDLGTEIEMDLNLLRLTENQHSQVHYTLAKVSYPGGAVGFLLYIKLSVSGDEKDFVLDYRARNPDFPHQSTADQLYDEFQFEAYRALGEHVTEYLFRPPLTEDDNIPPASIREWFESLVEHLGFGVRKQQTPNQT